LSPWPVFFERSDIALMQIWGASESVLLTYAVLWTALYCSPHLFAMSLFYIILLIYFFLKKISASLVQNKKKN
jgi:hypothetical protein